MPSDVPPGRDLGGCCILPGPCDWPHLSSLFPSNSLTGIKGRDAIGTRVLFGPSEVGEGSYPYSIPVNIWEPQDLYLIFSGSWPGVWEVRGTLSEEDGKK